MNFDFDDDQEMLRSATHSFLESRSSLDQRRVALEQPEIFDRGVWSDGADLGWTAMLVPEAYGGGSVSSQPLVDLVVIAEEFGRSLQPGPLLSANVIADAVVRHGNDAQRAKYLPEIAAGTIVPAWTTTTDGSADLDAIGVRATIATDGSVTLRGSAGFVHCAAAADLLLVTAMGDNGPMHVLVPTNAAGLSVRPLSSLDLTRRFASVRFDGVAVSADGVLAHGDASLALHRRALDIATVIQSAECVGAAEHLFGLTLQYTKDRVQFGRAIGSFQAIKHRMANLAVTLEAMRAAAHYAALAVAEQSNGFEEVPHAVATAGAYVKEAHAFLCGECLQLLGGIGFTWEHDLHLYLRRARTEEVLHGDPVWHREQLCQLVSAEPRLEPASAREKELV